MARKSAISQQRAELEMRLSSNATEIANHRDALLDALETLLAQSADWMPSTGKAGEARAKARAAIAMATGSVA